MTFNLRLQHHLWLNDLWDPVEHARVLNVAYCSETALGSILPSTGSAKARVAMVGALLRLSLPAVQHSVGACCSVGPSSNLEVEDLPEASVLRKISLAIVDVVLARRFLIGENRE